jgi:predicted phosphodiesterase
VRDLGIAVVQGNYDRGVGGRLGGCGCHYATEQARLDGEASYHFTVGALDERDLRWLYELPGHMTLFEGSARILLAHGSPRKINEYLTPDRPDELLARLAVEAAVDVVCVGHVHVPYHRIVDSEAGLIHYVNSGSVGKPKDGDPRAGWVELVLGSEEEVGDAAPADESRGAAGESALWVGAVVHRVTYDEA